MMKEYCRSDKGKRCYQNAMRQTNDNKVFTKYTLLVAISTKGVVGYKLFVQNSKSFDLKHKVFHRKKELLIKSVF